jgi:hypothetical protein
MYSQLRRYPEIVAYMALRRVRIVHLLRLNLIDIVVSEELANITGTSHAQVGKPTGVPKVYLNPATLIDRISRRGRRPKQARSVMRVFGCPLLEVTYESLLESEREFARIVEFLDGRLPAAPFQSSLEKRGTGNHRDAIDNYDEVKQVLKSTPFSAMLR